MPVVLPLLLDAAGFVAVAQQPVTIVNRQAHPNTFAYGAARLMAAFARGRAELDDAAIAARLSSLERAAEVGTHFLALVPILTTASRPT